MASNAATIELASPSRIRKPNTPSRLTRGADADSLSQEASSRVYMSETELPPSVAAAD
jgi:hypothetical protein